MNIENNRDLEEEFKQLLERVSEEERARLLELIPEEEPAHVFVSKEVFGKLIGFSNKAYQCWYDVLLQLGDLDQNQKTQWVNIESEKEAQVLEKAGLVVKSKNRGFFKYRVPKSVAYMGK
jgi:hypothetical protein